MTAEDRTSLPAVLLVSAGAALLAAALLSIIVPAAQSPGAAVPVLLIGCGGGIVAFTRPAWLLPAWAALTWSAIGAHWFGGLPSPVEFGALGLLAAGLWLRRRDLEQLRLVALVTALVGLPWMATALLSTGSPSVPHALMHDLPLIAVTGLVVRGRADARRVLIGLTAVGTFLGAGAVWSILVGPTELFPLNASSAVFEYEAPRAAGPFGEANFFALSLVVLLPIALMLLRGTRAERVLGGVGALTLTGGILATGSRAALIAAVVAIVGTALLQRSARLLLVVAVAAVISVPVFAAQLEGAGTRSTTGRSSEAQVALAMAGDHPLAGVGPDRFPLLYRDYARRVGSDPRSDREAHSLPLQILAEQGIVGALGWLAAAGVLIATIRRGRVLEHDEGKALVLALATFAVGSLFLHGSQLRLLWILIGVTLAVARPLATPTGRPA